MHLSGVGTPLNHVLDPVQAGTQVFDFVLCLLFFFQLEPAQLPTENIDIMLFHSLTVDVLGARSERSSCADDVR